MLSVLLQSWLDHRKDIWLVKRMSVGMLVILSGARCE